MYVIFSKITWVARCRKKGSKPSSHTVFRWLIAVKALVAIYGEKGWSVKRPWLWAAAEVTSDWFKGRFM